MIKTLIVATNATPTGIAQDVAVGRHHRVDYLDLAETYGSDYVDYSLCGGGLRPVRWLEERLRIDARLAQKVRRIVVAEGYDVVLSLSERVGIPLTHVLPARVKHVVIMHHPMSSRKLPLLRTLRVKDRWSRIIAISSAEARAFEQALGIASGEVVPLHTPVDVDFFDPAQEQCLAATEQDRVQSLGLSHRDYSTLIRAMRRIPYVKCNLRVGSTWVNGRAGHESESIPENITVKDYVHPQELRRRYLESRFIIVPIQESTQWSAGCTTIQQAQAMGRAVIATARPGLAEYLVDGETGILVEPGDDVGLSNAIEYLWKNPDVAECMGRKGREHQVRNFAMDQWIEHLRQIVAGVHDGVHMKASA